MQTISNLLIYKGLIFHNNQLRLNIMLKHSLAFVSISILLTGCMTAPTITLTTPFDSDYAQKMLADGTNMVKGSALIRQAGGGVVTCAGNEVLLIPNT
ncbi:MAG: hypothetical protein KA902_04010, partial [Arenimonas sp.]|nr:hypothetical protein [Arenimonas sp.]